MELAGGTLVPPPLMEGGAVSPVGRLLPPPE